MPGADVKEEGLDERVIRSSPTSTRSAAFRPREPQCTNMCSRRCRGLRMSGNDSKRLSDHDAYVIEAER